MRWNSRPATFVFAQLVLSTAIAASAERGTDNGAIPAVCSGNGSLSRSAAIDVRNELSKASLTKDRLLQIQQTLQKDFVTCFVNLDPANLQFAGMLYLHLGDQFLSIHETDNALQTFSKIDELFSQSGQPSLAWLEILQSKARAEMQKSDFTSANNTADRQTKLARNWVAKKRFFPDTLADALRFQASVLDSQRRFKEAAVLVKEANRIDPS